MMVRYAVYGVKSIRLPALAPILKMGSDDKDNHDEKLYKLLNVGAWREESLSSTS